MLHNWLYFVSLGLSMVNLPLRVATVVNPDGSTAVTPVAIRVSGDIEALDNLLTFIGVGFLGSLSDVIGRRPLMAWSSVGFGTTCFLQAQSTSIGLLYVADAIDGVSSCMTEVCQSYVSDTTTTPAEAAVRIGMLQGFSISGAFIVAFPVGAILGKRFGPRLPCLIAAGLQALNALIVLLLTPESLPRAKRSGRTLDLRAANPIGALKLLFTRSALLRDVCIAYVLVALARGSLDAQFLNNVRYRFGWDQSQAAPLMILVGMMLAVAPRAVVPRIGVRRSVLLGTLVFALGQTCAGLAPTPAAFVIGVMITSVGCACIPALLGIIASTGDEAERGAVLGGLGSLQKLCAAATNSGYARVFAYFISAAAPVQIPGAPFLVSALLLACAFSVSARAFGVHGAALSVF